MKVLIPNGFKDDVKDMSECELLLIAALSVLHNIFGTDAYLEMDNGDIRRLLYCNVESASNNLYTTTLLKPVQEKGYIRVGLGTDNNNVLLQINKEKYDGMHGKFGGTKVLYNDKSFEAELKDIESIKRFCYFLGRLANVIDGSEIKEIKQGLLVPHQTKTKIRKFVHLVPSFYQNQVSYDSTMIKKNRERDEQQSI